MQVKKVKIFFSKYLRTAVFLAVFVPLFFGGALVNFANGVPPRDGLMEVEIESSKLNIQEFHHMDAVLADGRIVKLIFPDSISFFPRSFRGLPGVKDDQIDGCVGVAKIVPVNLIVGDVFRVWDLRCKSISMPYENLKIVFDKRIGNHIFFQTLLFFTLLLVGIFGFMLDREKST